MQALGMEYRCGDVSFTHTVIAEASELRMDATYSMGLPAGRELAVVYYTPKGGGTGVNIEAERVLPDLAAPVEE